MALTSKLSLVALGVGTIEITDAGQASHLSPAVPFAEAFQALDGSFSFTQADGETKEIKTVKGNIIAATTVDGKLSFKFVVPNTAKAMVNMFFKTVTVAEAAPAGYEVVGIKTEAKAINKMMKIHFSGSDQIYVFPFLSISRKFSGDNPQDTPIGIEISATVLSNPVVGEPDFYTLNKMDGTV